MRGIRGKDVALWNCRLARSDMVFDVKSSKHVIYAWLNLPAFAFNFVKICVACHIEIVGSGTLGSSSSSLMPCVHLDRTSLVERVKPTLRNFGKMLTGILTRNHTRAALFFPSLSRSWLQATLVITELVIPFGAYRKPKRPKTEQIRQLTGKIFGYSVRCPVSGSAQMVWHARQNHSPSVETSSDRLF